MLPVQTVPSDDVTGSLERSELLSRAVAQVPLASWWWVALAVVIMLGCWFFAVRLNQRLWLLVLIPLAVAAFALGVSSVFRIATGAQETLGDVFGVPDYDVGASSQISDPRGSWPRGLVVRTTVPANSSGVGEQPAWVYLPPDYFEERNRTFPAALVLPDASPEDAAGPDTALAEVFDEGGLAGIGFDLAESGSPIVLVVPATSPTGEASQCADSIMGGWQRFLSEDVMEWVDQYDRWDVTEAAVGGVGMGGYCAQVTALRNPTEFGWFGNISGTTDLNYPGGSEALLGSGRGALDAVNWDSAQIVENYPNSRDVQVWLSHGVDDPAVVIDEQTEFAAIAADYGMDVTEQQYPAGRWDAWTQGLTDWLTAVARDRA